MAIPSAPNEMLPVKEMVLSLYLPLYKAALRGDWDAAKIFDLDAVTARITERSETALHVAAASPKATQFLNNLLDMIPPNSLETLVDSKGNTALHSAAKFGNTVAAKLLVAKNQRLPNTWTMELLHKTPLHLAAEYGHRELTLYLFTVTKEDVNPNPFAGDPGVSLLNSLIFTEVYDMALQLVQSNPILGTLESIAHHVMPLDAIARKPSAFPSGARYKAWQWFIYSCIPLKSENTSGEPNVGDLENPCECCLLCTKTGTRARFLGGAHLIHVCQMFYHMIWSIMERLVPQIKNIKETKHTHEQTLELVKSLCIISLDDTTPVSRFAVPIIYAAKLGIHEIVQEILDSDPGSGWFVNENGHNIFHLAVINRREKVFNLLYQLSEHSRIANLVRDKKGNSILHLAGKLPPTHRINIVSGAALQMQRELQWYKEVKKWVPLGYEEYVNSKGETPAIIFTEEHKDLVKEGEKWMKDTATSCSVAAALIVTIAFAAAITVPGGSGGGGLPVFSKEATFLVFVISNAVSLFSSTASLIMFLSILTARYAEGDFLYSLPRRLIIGLITLFLSITSMMVAFSATLYLVLGQKKAWVLAPVAGSACLPVTLFVTLQFPLLLDIIRCTYCPGTFGCNK